MVHLLLSFLPVRPSISWPHPHCPAPPRGIWSPRRFHGNQRWTPHCQHRRPRGDGRWTPRTPGISAMRHGESVGIMDPCRETLAFINLPWQRMAETPIKMVTWGWFSLGFTTLYDIEWCLKMRYLHWFTNIYDAILFGKWSKTMGGGGCLFSDKPIWMMFLWVEPALWWPQ